MKGESLNKLIDLLEQARTQLILCTLIDRSGQCQELVEKIEGGLKSVKKKEKIL